MNGNKFATDKILEKPVEVVKGRILAGWDKSLPNPETEVDWGPIDPVKLVHYKGGFRVKNYCTQVTYDSAFFHFTASPEVQSLTIPISSPRLPNVDPNNRENRPLS
jgi:hypothetical protein